ncbi:MAG: single-stranded DNA-binding protein [Candidatus Portnoybacteria bacterium CG_4_8_14_3_um_filter_44_15]|uniref:Single-stranded DNA-binding protein n=3 Tax=Candidatus Portnoyibacteriota TaxID=1817913 RepID=A0A2M7YM45_9BACT|nr:MAG: hypothetical protein AUJ11_01375 [Parcubacteria group bacterium CG1_02_44_65]PIW74652.1 MAG: single-stranded DNA-binding protein [Candidatus Portnoybacteria bacterium CG_4_8_14_3_um_filter_44_15]PJA64020.1 MAG: single-stranded DNA-binding protein [Candidatus Portnoybacteria bacterium CG_4_9_14_3_um_filter_43_11]
MNLNKAFILGRLTRDPEVRTTTAGGNVVNFSIATNRVWSDKSGNKQDATEYHNVVTFGKLADICSQYLSKGRLVLIEGRIQTRSWQDKDGNKKYWTEIVAENMQMGPRTESGQRSPEQKPSPASQEEPVVNQEEIPVIEAEEPIRDDESNLIPAEEKAGVDVRNIPF